MLKINSKNKKVKKIVIIIISTLILIFATILILVINNKQVLKSNIPQIEDNRNNNIYNKDTVELKPKSVISSVPIFMYHFILDDYGKNLDVENFLKPSTLEQQLKYISENNYQTIFVNEIQDLHKYTKPVSLTFDDCFVYFYDNAFPLFKKYNQKATINIIVNYINGENYLTDAQIKEMAGSGLISVQSHTLSHKELTTLSSEQEKKEINESKEILDSKYEIEVDTLCYPIGKYNDETINIAKEKYKYALAMTGGVYYSNKHDLYRIPRIYANRSMPLSEFISYLQKSNVKVEW